MDVSNEEQKLHSVVARFEAEINNLRTGRAHISMVENVVVEAYGAKTPLRNVASFATPDARTIVIKPWDKIILPAIEQALLGANVGGAPIAEKDQVRMVIPAPTEERRTELVKVLKRYAEEARISVRQHRDALWKRIQNTARDGEISEDQKFQQKEKMEKLIEKINEQLSDIAAKKEQEI